MTPADLSTAQWDYIRSVMQTEAASGRLRNVQWTNAAGQAVTSTLGDVRRSLHLFSQQPAGTASAGVMLSSVDIARYAAGRRKMTTEFSILIAVEAVAYTDNSQQWPANGDDAIAQAYAFVSDGHGNGLSEILRDPANYTLGGNAETCIVTKVAPILSIGDGATPEIWAYLYLTLQAQAIVAV